MTTSNPFQPIDRARINKTLCYMRHNPQLAFTIGLSVVGLFTTHTFPAFGGALFGAAATLLGTWISENQNRRAEAEKHKKQEDEAKEYLAPELYRVIRRALYIHERAIPNYTCAATKSSIQPNDLKEDFLPYKPVLYPVARQFRDLSGDDAIALVSFYDSLQTLENFVRDWWGREGQLPANIFNMILAHAEESLKLAQICIVKFDLDRKYPTENPIIGSLSAWINRSIKSAKDSQDAHIKRAEQSK